MLFEWDPKKDLANFKKHGISFELAQTVFEDPLHLSVLEGKASNEERWVTVGRSADAKTTVVVHTYRSLKDGQEVNRIISARRATKKEAKDYEEGI